MRYHTSLLTAPSKKENLMKRDAHAGVRLDWWVVPSFAHKDSGTRVPVGFPFLPYFKPVDPTPTKGRC